MIAEMAAQLLELEGDHIEVVQNNAAGKRSVISDAELDMLLGRKEVFEGRGVCWKSGAVAAAKTWGVPVVVWRRRRADADGGLLEVYEAPRELLCVDMITRAF
jgi:ATP-dependent DNA helicase